ncbi:HAMP domain-containing histidine kinase [bacterium]|nr:HAMP domain-containing histidine kinase [bacterium]
MVKSVPFPSFRAAKPPLLAGKLIITQNRSNWFSLVSELTHQIIFTFGIAVLAIFIAGFVISGRVSQPLRDLTLKADKLDLDKLEMHFSESGNKETKALATVLNQMILRLRNSSQTIIEAERRATLGDMARQINHDVRNGFLPIRNVLNHLAQLVDANPDEFVKVFNERKSTLDSGIEYLEELASSYAKVSGKPELEQCNVNQIICDTVDGIKQVEVVTNSESTVIADPMSLRRIIQNLVKNGVQHLPESGGVVTVTTSEKDGSATITVSDNGCGMDQETIDQIFNHFFTTRKEGSGLGLSIVKRLVNDCNGFIKVQSEPGKSSTFTVSIPLPAGENSDG